MIDSILRVVGRRHQHGSMIYPVIQLYRESFPVLISKLRIGRSPSLNGHQAGARVSAPAHRRPDLADGINLKIMRNFRLRYTLRDPQRCARATTFVNPEDRRRAR